jgi:hypothetical protein
LPQASAAQRPKPAAIRRRSAIASMQFEEDDGSDEETAMIASGSKHDLSNAESSSSKKAKLNGSEPSTSQATPTRRGASYKHTAPGSIDFCGMCASKFTITAYT